MQRDIHLTCVRRMDMYMLCITGSVAWFWGDVCAPQVCLEGNCFTVCGDLHAILCAVKRQASVVHRRVLYSVTGGQPCRGRRYTSRVTGGQAFMEDGAGLRRMAGVCWRMGLLLEDSVHGRQDFAGGCSELYISLYKNEGVVCMCCVTAVCAWTDFGVCMPHRLT